MDTVPCVVSMDTARHYREMEDWDSFCEGLEDYVREGVMDDMLCKGKVEIMKLSNGTPLYFTMAEMLSEYFDDDEDGERQFVFAALASAVTTADDEEDAKQRLQDFINEAAEWYYIEDDKYMKYQSQYEEYLADDSI